jgi:hypothetical protein
MPIVDPREGGEYWGDIHKCPNSSLSPKGRVNSYVLSLWERVGVRVTSVV